MYVFEVFCVGFSRILCGYGDLCSVVKIRGDLCLGCFKSFVHVEISNSGLRAFGYCVPSVSSFSA